MEEALSRFQTAISDFQWRNNGAIICEKDPNIPDAVRHIVRLPDVPRVARRMAYQVVSHARNALDQACYAGSVCINGKTNRTCTHFPFGTDPDDFDIAVRNRQSKHIAAEIIPTIKMFEPWYSGPSHDGGNDILRALGKISGPNKHQVGLTPHLDIAGMHAQEISASIAYSLSIPPTRIENTNDFLCAVTPKGAEIQYQAQIAFFISIRHVDEAVGRMPAEIAFRKMAEITRTIVEAMQQRTAAVVIARS